MNGGRADDDIEFLSHDHPNKTICQLCAIDLTPLTLEKRQLHYEEHLSGQSEVSGPSSSSIKKATHSLLKSPAKVASKPRFKSQFKQPFELLHRNVSVDEQNIFWHASQSSDPPPNFSPGLIPVLKKALTKSHEKGVTQRAWLAFEQAVHIYREYWDAHWGCGYRNYLMACAALMDQQRQPMYLPLLHSPPPPGLRNLQLTLEEAWKNDYDEDGAREYKYKLVDTNKWIGTAEIYVAFTYRGIPAQLVDFSDLSGGVEPLLQWIYDYFSGGDPQPKSTTVGEALKGARPVIVTDKLPIILQHQGHSRTIVGCEKVKNGTITLLTFDPSRRISPLIRQAGLHYHNRGRHKAASVSEVVHKVMHPVETIKSKKRKSLESPPDESGPKRTRPSDPAARIAADVIVIESDSEDEKPTTSSTKAAQPDELDLNDVLKLFRIDAKFLKKKDKYQILYFPLEEPLTEQQKCERRIVESAYVESEKVT
ncbi:DUF1671-domain-containing protein [Trametes sanguinea]|nr:DUF1671-domain-containing protein [Trametes sanguinea]